MRLSQNKFFRNVFICFALLASTLTTCESSAFKTDDNKSASTRPRQFNKTNGVVGLALCIMVGTIAYKYIPSSSEQTQPSLRTNSNLFDEQNKNEELQLPVNDPYSGHPHTLQKSNDEEKDPDKNHPSYTDSAVQEYPESNRNSGVNASDILGGVREDNNINSDEDNIDQVEQQRKALEYWNKQKQGGTSKDKEGEKRIEGKQGGGKEARFEENCAFCTESVLKRIYTDQDLNAVTRIAYCCQNFLHYGCLKQIKEHDDNSYNTRCIVCRNNNVYPEWLTSTYRELKLDDYTLEYVD